ncbi:hypothetical protein CBL_20210 [Carabus blaptoides fortunei]
MEIFRFSPEKTMSGTYVYQEYRKGPFGTPVMDRRKRGTKRPLSLGELEEIAAQFGEQSFSESDGSDDVYAPSETDDDDVVSESDTEDNDGGNSARTDNPNGVLVPNVAVEVHPKSEERNASDTSTSYILWSEPDSTFVPKYTIPDKRSCKLHSDIKTNLTSLEYFKKTFPSSLYMYIAQCTNERLEIFKKEKKNKRLSIRETDRGEIQIGFPATSVAGCERAATEQISGVRRIISKFVIQFPSRKNHNWNHCDRFN